MRGGGVREFRRPSTRGFPSTLSFHKTNQRSEITLFSCHILLKTTRPCLTIKDYCFFLLCRCGIHLPFSTAKCRRELFIKSNRVGPRGVIGKLLSVQIMHNFTQTFKNSSSTRTKKMHYLTLTQSCFNHRRTNGLHAKPSR